MASVDASGSCCGRHGRPNQKAFLRAVHLDDLCAIILRMMVDNEPDLELIEWTVPVLTSATDDGPKCPECGAFLTFVSFIRIRPLRLYWRSTN